MSEEITHRVVKLVTKTKQLHFLPERYTHGRSMYEQGCVYELPVAEADELLNNAFIEYEGTEYIIFEETDDDPTSTPKRPPVHDDGGDMTTSDLMTETKKAARVAPSAQLKKRAKKRVVRIGKPAEPEGDEDGDGEGGVTV